MVKILFKIADAKGTSSEKLSQQAKALIVLQHAIDYTKNGGKTTPKHYMGAFFVQKTNGNGRSFRNKIEKFLKDKIPGFTNSLITESTKEPKAEARVEKTEALTTGSGSSIAGETTTKSKPSTPEKTAKPEITKKTDSTTSTTTHATYTTAMNPSSHRGFFSRKPKLVVDTNIKIFNSVDTETESPTSR